MLPIFEWLEQSWLGSLIRDSVWVFPVLEAIHLLGLGLLGGALLLLDLRMLGIGLTRQPIAGLARALRPWLLGALATMLATGVPLFLSEAVKCYHNPAFRVKILTLPLALGYTFLVRGRAVRSDALETGARSRLIAFGSLGLWFTVAAAGRWIGFSS
jgi:hypothetical protein